MKDCMDVFGEYYEKYNFGQVWMPHVLDELSLYFKEPVLDIGCFDGEKTNYYYKKGFKKIEGCDISDIKIYEARKKYPYINFFKHDFQINDLKKKYQTIYAFEVIEHIFNTEAFLKNVSCSLEDGGYFLMTTPNLCSLINRIRILFGDGKCVSGNIDTSHIRFFTKKTIIEVLKKNGFKIIDIYGYNLKKFLKHIYLPTTLCEGLIVVAQTSK